MAKTYTKEEIKKLLKKHYNAESVIQSEDDYEDEFHILLREADGNSFSNFTVEVVSAMTAIKNESDFSNAKEFLLGIIEILLKKEELIQIGAYSKLAEDLFWRKY